MKLKRTERRWAAKWRSKNFIDGTTEHFIRFQEGQICVFTTRKDARDFITEKYGYIKDRPDLRKEPHGWKMPIPVRVEIRTREIP